VSRLLSFLVVTVSCALACGERESDDPKPATAGSGGASAGSGGVGGASGLGGKAGSGGVAGSGGALVGGAAGGMMGEGGEAGEPASDDEDADGDTISDRDEGARGRDTDHDGTPDFRDNDSDQDGIQDGFEAGDENLATGPIDSDGDGTPDFVDTDSDDDGIPDATEISGGFDTDGDLTPDYLDMDSDNDDLPDLDEARRGLSPRDNDSDDDTISDGHEDLIDPDDDGVDNPLDEDSDGDGYDDADEAGDAIVDTPPVDSDADGDPDFLDFDSDGDGLPDEKEGTCGRLAIDGDGDGYSDLVEVLTEADPCDEDDTVLEHGVEFFFVLPFEGPPQTATLRFVPRVTKADVFFQVDTTSSMSGVIASLKSGLGSIITSTRARVTDSGFGVASFEDFPQTPFGNVGDEPFHVFTGVTLEAEVAQAAANALALGAGGDLPESGFEALFQAVDGSGVTGAAGTFGPFGASDRVGGAQFRPGALPLIVHATDAESHDTVAATGNPAYPASFNAHDRDAAFDALDRVGARVITIQNGTSAPAAAHLREVSQLTRAVVPVCSFKTSATTWRCGADQCCLPDATAPTLGAGDVPECVLHYQIQGNGTGLADVTADGIDAIIKYTKFDVFAAGRDDGNGATPDTSQFLSRVAANTPDDTFKPPLEPELSCNPVPTPAAFAGATYDNGFSGFAVGSSSADREGARLFFTVRAENTTVPETAEPQMYRAFVDVVDERTGTVLDSQDVVVIVPGVPGGVGE